MLTTQLNRCFNPMIRFTSWTRTCQLAPRLALLSPRILSPHPAVLTEQPACGHRSRGNKKHYDIKFRKLRSAKVMKINLPDFDQRKKDSKMDPEERRSEMKKDGMLPPRTFQERPINISSSGDIFEPFVPPEGDGRASFISKERASQTLEDITKKGKSMWDYRKIKQYDEDFEWKQFAAIGQNMYIEAHDLLQDMKENDLRLHDLLSEKAFPEMTHTLGLKTFRWKFIETIEPARIVHIKTSDMMTKGNLYGQITVRMHTKQTLAIYDRFGRLMYGSENLVKDVLEYVVFEKHLSNEYGVWRIHGKIVPDWMPARQSVVRTYQHKEIVVPDDDETDQSEAAVEKAQVNEDQPQTAAA